MRVWSRIALVVVSLFSTAALMGASCPLSLAGSTPPATSFELSPHGVFRFNNLVYALRGQVLATYVVNDVGNLQIAREDFIGSLAGRNTRGGVAFSDGFLYISSEAGLEIYDLRNVRTGGSAPVLVHRAAGFNYHRLAVSGNRLAGLMPVGDLPCYPHPADAGACRNTIEIVDISTLTNPTRLGAINSFPISRYRGMNDVAFVGNTLIAVTEESLLGFNITNAAFPTEIADVDRPGHRLITNGTNFLAVGNDTYYDIYTVRTGMNPLFERVSLLSIPSYLTIDRANAIRFSEDAFYDEANARFVTMIDEVDPMTLDAARTIAFDVFDFRVPHYEGSAERVYEDVTFTTDDEVKHNPLSAGNNVYVIGERTGLQTWGSCGIASGRIELDSPRHLTCNGAELRGWVTGPQKIVNVELFLNNTALGAATLGGPLRFDVSSPTPVSMWRVGVNLDQTPAGEYTLRAIATDALGVRRQFAARPIHFGGPGSNCTTPRRRSVGR
jgi:hypothetical protein